MNRWGGFRSLASMWQRAINFNRLGISFGGERDIYLSAGYNKKIDYDDYLLRYLRQGMAKRIVNALPDECWRLEPEMLDGLDLDSAKSDTEFVKAWNALAKGGQIDGGETQPGLLHYMHRADRVCGVGRYAVILLGLADNKPLSEPVGKGALKSAGITGLAYVSIYDEGSARITEYENNVKSPRYGKPTYYDLTMRSGNEAESTQWVHWTRIVHISDGSLCDDLVGTPRLEAAWNDLLNLEKVMAAVGEAAYRLLNPGHILTTQDGYKLPVVDPRMPPEIQQAMQEAIDSRSEQIDDFTNGFRRFLELEGMDVRSMEGKLQDPTGAIQGIIDMISAATGFPQRILLGSERGEQASTQDEENWAKVIEGRQHKHVKPIIIQQVTNRLIWLGVLPVPASGEYQIKFKSLLQVDQVETADVATKTADTITKIGARVDVKKFAKAFIPALPVDAIEEKPEPVTPLPGALPGQDQQPQDGSNPKGPQVVNVFIPDVVSGDAKSIYGYLN